MWWLPGIRANLLIEDLCICSRSQSNLQSRESWLGYTDVSYRSGGPQAGAKGDLCSQGGGPGTWGWGWGWVEMGERGLGGGSATLPGSASGASLQPTWVRSRLPCWMQAGNSCGSGESWRAFPIWQQEKDLLGWGLLLNLRAVAQWPRPASCQGHSHVRAQLRAGGRGAPTVFTCFPGRVEDGPFNDLMHILVPSEYVGVCPFRGQSLLFPQSLSLTTWVTFYFIPFKLLLISHFIYLPSLGVPLQGQFCWSNHRRPCWGG